jgi:hypothetical protein
MLNISNSITNCFLLEFEAPTAWVSGQNGEVLTKPTTHCSASMPALSNYLQAIARRTSFNVFPCQRPFGEQVCPRRQPAQIYWLRHTAPDK